MFLFKQNYFHFSLLRKNWFYFLIFLACSYYFINAIWVWGDGRIYAGGDMGIHIRYIKSAYHSLFVEKTFPPFYVNDIGVALQPIFKYYSIVFYIFAALFMKIGFTSYQGLLIATAFFYALGAWGIFLISRFLRARRLTSFIGSLVYLYSPYMFIVFYIRGAYSEISAIGIMPLLFYALIRLNASHGKRYGIRSSLLTALLLISHKIFFPWVMTIFFIFLILVSNLRSPLRFLKHRIFPTALWVGLGMISVSCYWLSSYMALKNLNVSSQIAFCYESLTHWKLLISPKFAVSPDSSTQGLATQYGVPIMVSAILLLLSVRKRKIRWTIFLLFTLFFLIQADVGGLLQIIPTAFKAVQFPYRLLTFSSIFGSLAAAIGISNFRFKKLQIPLMILMLYLINAYVLRKYRVIPPLAYATVSDYEKSEMTIQGYGEKIEKSLLNRFETQGIYDGGIVEQDAEIIVDRFPEDHAVLSFFGIMPDQIKSSDLWYEVYLNEKRWYKKTLTERKINIDEKLPSVPSIMKQRIKFRLSDAYIPAMHYSFTADKRKIILMNSKIRFSNKHLIYYEPSALKVRGSKVQIKLEMNKDNLYILPVFYSKYLKWNCKEINIEPDIDGIALKSDKNGNYDLVIQRIESVYLNYLSGIAVFIIILIGVVKGVKFLNRKRVIFAS